MFNRVSSLVLTILLFLIFQGSAANLNVFIIALVVFIGSTLAVNYKRIGFSLPHLSLPCLYLLGMGGLYMVITTPWLRFVFLIVAAIIFYSLQMQLGRESHFLQNVYLFSAFAIYIGLFGLQYYFHIGYFGMTFIIFAASYLLILQGFTGFILPVKKYFSFLIALVTAEVAWGLSLWPTYYVINALLCFLVFYLLWIFSFSAFFGKLTRNKIYWQLSLVTILILIVFATTNFKPLGR